MTCQKLSNHFFLSVEDNSLSVSHWSVERIVFKGRQARSNSYRYVLYVNVEGHNDVTQSTTIQIHRYNSGSAEWLQDTTIADWTIYGRNYADYYIDKNIIASGLRDATVVA